MMQDVLDRVHKLLALAGSPNVHEAAAAAAKSQALIEPARRPAAMPCSSMTTSISEPRPWAARHADRGVTLLAWEAG